MIIPTTIFTDRFVRSVQEHPYGVVAAETFPRNEQLNVEIPLEGLVASTFIAALTTIPGIRTALEAAIPQLGSSFGEIVQFGSLALAGICLDLTDTFMRANAIRERHWNYERDRRATALARSGIRAG